MKVIFFLLETDQWRILTSFAIQMHTLLQTGHGCSSQNDPAARDWQHMHTMRGLKVKQRTQIINHMRGLMNEYGISCRTGAIWFENNVQEIIETALKNHTFPKLVVDELLIQVKDLEMIKGRIQDVEKSLLGISREDPCDRLTTIPGIGFLIGTMLYGYAGNAEYYKSGRDFAASLGLVPRQFSTGGKQTLGRISKRGNIDIRANLLQGARCALMGALKKRQTEKPSGSSLLDWALQCYDRMGMNKAAVAVANKISRIAWKILKTKNMTFVSTMRVRLGKGEHPPLSLLVGESSNVKILEGDR